MQQKSIRALLILSAWLWVQPLIGQIETPSTFQIKHSYQSVNEEYYLIEDTLNLTPAERIEVTHRLEIYQHDRYQQTDGQETTLISLLGSNNSESWMNTAGYFVIHPEGMKVYDLNQNLIYESPHSEFYLEKSAYTGSEFFPSFPALSDERKEELQQAGIQVNGDPGNLTLQFGNRKLIYHQANKTLAIKEFDNQNNLKSSTQIGFITLSGGENVMAYLKEIQPVTLSGGTCARKVSTRTFSNHQVSYGKKKSPKSILAESKLSITPNPVTHDLYFNLAGANEGIGILRIFNSEGRLILTEQRDINSTNTLSVERLKPGIYLLHLQFGTINEAIRFVKE